ncbi:hypothetical protein ALC53_07518 [Atta colombica]|uniref:Uncharacterized protein n=1 Tax=Atta colombica TaxID=520822 RepID=A0A151I2P1_9HYME|nr:hypothetical protein ALC53_07518 [Atta colombica]
MTELLIILERGLLRPCIPTCPDDGWTFYQPHPSQTSQTNIPLAPETDHQPEASLIAPTTTDQSRELSPDHPTSIRPIRHRMTPRRLVLDPSAYFQW